MILVAQRVLSPRGIQGINAYRYRVALSSWPADPLSLLDKSEATLDHSTIQLRPGGNRVLSYLDLAAPDDLHLEEIVRQVEEIAAGPPPAKFPLEITKDRLSMHFGLESRLAPLWREELQDLLRHAILA